MSIAGHDGAGLPDVETLTRLANEFFSALPGSTPAQVGNVNAGPVAGSVPAPPGTRSSISTASIDNSLAGGNPAGASAAPFAVGANPAAVGGIPTATPVNPLAYAANPLAFTSNPLSVQMPGEAELRGARRRPALNRTHRPNRYRRWHQPIPWRKPRIRSRFRFRARLNCAPCSHL